MVGLIYGMGMTLLPANNLEKKEKKLKMELVGMRKPFLTSLISPYVTKPGNRLDFLSVPYPLYILHLLIFVKL